MKGYSGAVLGVNGGLFGGYFGHEWRSVRGLFAMV